MTSLVRPGVVGTAAPHEISRSAVMQQREIELKKQEDRRIRLRGVVERRAALRAHLAAQNTVIQDNVTHAWVLFEGSEAEKRMRQRYREVMESTEARHGAIEGRVPIKRQAKDWDRNLRTKILDDIVGPAVADDLSRDTLVSMYNRSEHGWRAAFTDPSWNPNPSGNYERLEKTGDTSVKLGLQYYSIESRPDITEHELTVAVNTILAKQEQARVSRALGLPSLIRSLYDEPNTDEEEDVFESFFGALYEMGETENMGQQLVNIVFYWLVEQGYINMKDRVFDTPPKTQVSTLFASLGWGVPLENTKREVDGWVTQLFMEDSVRRTAANREVKILDIYDAKNRMLKSTPYPVVNPAAVAEIAKTGLIATGRGANEALSKYNAYQAAVDKFKTAGLIREVNFLEHLGLNQSFDPYYEKEFFAALRKALAEGYDNIFVTESKVRYDSKGMAYINLIGIRGTDRTVIYTISIPDRRSAAERKKEPPLPKKEIRRIIYQKYAEARDRVVNEADEEEEEDIFMHDDSDDSEEEEDEEVDDEE